MKSLMNAERGNARAIYLSIGWSPYILQGFVVLHGCHKAALSVAGREWFFGGFSVIR